MFIHADGTLGTLADGTLVDKRKRTKPASFLDRPVQKFVT